MKSSGMGRAGLGILLTLLVAAGNVRAGHALQAAGMVFQQVMTDGLVVMEAESFRTNNPGTGAPTHTWNLLTAPAGASGNAMQALPESGTRLGGSFEVPPEPFAPDISPRLDFRVLFVATGTHYVWVRGRGLDGGSDSCHVGLDAAAVASAERINGYTTTAPTPYEWRAITMSGPVATINVATTGLHTVNLWMREDSFIADKILLTTNAAYAGVSNAGTMIGPAQSAQVPDPTPAAPVLSGTPGPVSAILSWTAVTGATSYNVLRSTTTGGPYTQIANVTGTTYTDTPLTFGTTYYYVVQAVNTFGASPNSNQVAISPLPPPPRPPSDNDEGLWGDRCACGSADPPAGSWTVAAAALAALGLLLLAQRR